MGHNKKTLSIILIPYNCAKNLTLNISRKIVVLIALVSISILFLTAIGLYSILRFDVFGSKGKYLVWENKQLKGNIKELEREIFDIRNSLINVSTKNHEISALLNLPVSDSKIGVGGPQLSFEDKSTKPKNVSNILSTIDSIKVALFVEKRILEDNFRQLNDNQTLLKTTPSIKPVNGYLTAGYGMRLDPFTGAIQAHQGIDLAAPRGTPVHTTADGIVKYSGFYKGYGKLVIIRHGLLYETWYAHLHTINVNPGKKVNRNEIIGTVGSTGYATGTHLHYEVHISGKPTNPLNYFYPELVVE